jgi:hypothetical protein
MFLVRVLLLWDFLFWLGLPYISRFWPHIYAISTEIFMKNRSIWYSTSSSSEDLPNERNISDLFINMRAIFQSKPPHRTPIQNHPKTAESVDCSISTRFLVKFPGAARSTHRLASKTPCFRIAASSMTNVDSLGRRRPLRHGPRYPRN